MAFFRLVSEKRFQYRFRKQVSVSASENSVSEKSIGFGKFGFGTKSLGFGQHFGLVTVLIIDKVTIEMVMIYEVLRV